MKKKLDLNMTEPIVTECWNYCRLAAILSLENELWYSENFWDINIYDGFISYYYEIDSDRQSMPNYDEVLTTYRLSSNEDIISQIIEAIDCGGYPILYLLFDAEKNISHEILINGYDTDKKTCSVIVYVGQPNYWKNVEVSFYEIQKKYVKEIELLKNNKKDLLHFWGLDYPASVLFVKKSEANRPNFHKLYKTVRRMLYSGYQGATGVKMYAEEEERWLNIHRGIEIYRLFYYDLYNLLLEDRSYINANNSVLNCIYKILESKQKIKSKLLFYVNNKYLPNIDSLLVQIDALCKHIEIAMINIERYMIRPSIKFIDKMKYNMQTAELIDKAILEQLLVIFETKSFEFFLDY